MIDDIARGAPSSSPRDFTLAGPPVVFFAANGGNHDSNEELWKITFSRLVAPDVGSIAIDSELVLVGNPVTVSAAFTDTSLLGGHTATWDWGDGTRTQGVVTESDHSGIVIGTHIYDTPGSYEVSVTVVAQDGVVGNEEVIITVMGTCQECITNVIIPRVEVLVERGVLKTGAGKSLTKKLESAIDLMDKGNLPGASQKLNDFIDQVNALIRSDRLSDEEGQEIIALVQELLDYHTT